MSESLEKAASHIQKELESISEKESTYKLKRNKKLTKFLEKSKSQDNLETALQKRNPKSTKAFMNLDGETMALLIAQATIKDSLEKVKNLERSTKDKSKEIAKIKEQTRKEVKSILYLARYPKLCKSEIDDYHDSLHNPDSPLNWGSIDLNGLKMSINKIKPKNKRKQPPSNLSSLTYKIELDLRVQPAQNKYHKRMKKPSKSYSYSYSYSYSESGPRA